MSIKRLIPIALTMMLLTVSLFSQTATGTFVGIITDQSGAVVPGATITVKNPGTNRSVTVESNESGVYVVPQLNPGEYEVVVAKAGFKRTVRNVSLQVDQRATIDMTLISGDINESVEVKETASLLEANSSSLGQVIGNERIVGLPLNARGVFNLVALSAGVIPNQDSFFVQQADSSINPSLFKANGGRSLTNEVLIDGVPNNGGSFGQIALHPTVDAVQEFKVQTNNYSAEYGNSGGAVVNVNIKSGTNNFHGALWEFLRNDALDANNFFANRAKRAKGKFRFNQYGGVVGGPIYLPRFGEGGSPVYDGHDKSFFFFSYEGVKRVTGIDPVFLSVPTEAQRRGDFSNLRDASGNLISIFDPLTTRTDPATGRIVRTQFANNIIPDNRISAVAKNLLNYLPQPNTTPSNAFTQANNYITQEPNRLDQYQVNTRIDHSISTNNTISGRYSHNRSDNAPANLFGNVAAPNFGALTFIARNAMVQDVHTFSPTTLLTLRAGLSRFTTDRLSPGGAVNVGAIGLPSYIPGLTFPRFDIAGYSSIGTPVGNFIKRAVNIYTFQGSLNKITGNHDLKIGSEFRAQQQNTFQPSAVSGQFSFTRDFLQGPIIGQANNGDGFAALLLGFPLSSTLSNDAAVAESRPYLAFYIQDNYKITRKLTLNLGLRYDLHMPRTERFNRLLNFGPTATEPTTGRAGAFRFVGRTIDTRNQFDTDTNNFGPRLGFAYQIDEKTVIRGGAALNYISPFNEGDTISGLGLSPTFSTRGVNTQSSTTVPTISISNPFPTGLIPPVGDAPGLAALVGDSGTFLERRYPISEFYNWNLGIQREVRADLMVEVAYAGSKGNKLAGPAIEQNALRPEFLALGDALRERVANPFFGKITTGALSTATVEQQLLLRQFPQFISVSRQGVHDYFSNYHSLLLSVQKRLSAGFSVSGAYTLSKLIDNSPGNGEAGGAPQNIYNRAAEKSISGEDIPQRLVISYLYELPFGRGKRFLSQGPLAIILGGWEVAGISTFSKERPLVVTSTGGAPFLPGRRRPNLIGDPNLSEDERTFLRWFNTAAFAFPANDYTFGSAPRTLPSTRRPGFQIWDISLQKNTPLKEGINLEFRFEMFNAFNKTNFLGPNTQFGNASFGQITAARTARQIQFALKLIY